MDQDERSQSTGNLIPKAVVGGLGPAEIDSTEARQEGSENCVRGRSRELESFKPPIVERSLS